MLTGMNILILGGDARQLEVIKKLNELDAHLLLVGFDQLDHHFNGAAKIDMEDIEVSALDAIILPVSGVGDDGKVETTFSDKEVVLEADWLTQTPDHCQIFTGITTTYLKQCSEEADRGVVPLFKRDDVAIYNSVPTVEGTLLMVIQNTDITIHAANVVILGLGRTGMSLARTLHALGANVKVGTKFKADIARITEMGLKPFYIKDLSTHVGDVDICLNTIPAKVLTGQVISHMPVNTLIVDIASKPGGTDFRYAEKRGIKTLHPLGLPGMVAPKTAGKIIANVVSEILEEQLPQEDDSYGS
ncbi:dipicolinic acid synthetase subunit A [Tuberibacillus sp. Marseille-P3662]|uniref:dipicolinic acid synthetase subunit A n=1 Tax=Tuberibacillus sp. Marseille-P3662 TaxID=1965358 RepID=UPI000A1CDC3D|nr:dipicolinic acid synthetase subunit A [Tuberibacillus sp. Marseille-P3662]